MHGLWLPPARRVSAVRLRVSPPADRVSFEKWFRVASGGPEGVCAPRTDDSKACLPKSGTGFGTKDTRKIKSLKRMEADPKGRAL